MTDAVPRGRGDEPRAYDESTARRDPFPADAGMNRIDGRVIAQGRSPFPADAGMNRLPTCRRYSGPVPRGRGDEPIDYQFFASNGPFPADAGMNRICHSVSGKGGPVPRGRGDEPDNILRRFRPCFVPRGRGDEPGALNNAFPQPFPADAGMNRRLQCWWTESPTVPRGRGDEPTRQETTNDSPIRSPRTRG